LNPYSSAHRSPGHVSSSLAGAIGLSPPNGPPVTRTLPIARTSGSWSFRPSSATGSRHSGRLLAPALARVADRSGVLGRLHVACDDLHRLVEPIRRAELDQRSSREDTRRVSRTNEVGLPADELLVTVGRVEHQLALEHVAPVLALA